MPAAPREVVVDNGLLQSPSPDQRAAVRAGLLRVLQRLDERTKDVPEEEMDAAINEAMGAVRPRNG